MAGRRPKPVEVKEAMGNPGKRRMPTPPPRVSGPVEAPKSFKGDSLTCWKRVAGLLANRLQLTQDSYESLVCLCETYADREKARKHLERKGWYQTVTTISGDRVERPRPAVAVYQDADRRYRSWLIEFGLTDASRGKVNVGRPQSPDASKGKAAGREKKSQPPLDRYGLN